MGTFELVNYVEEERILICDTLIIPGHTFVSGTWRQKERLPCNNLLKIKVTLVSGVPEQIQVVQDLDAYDEKGNRTRKGACLTYSFYPPYGSRRKYTYGPVNAKNVVFVHCKHCEKRWAWKAFKKAVF